MCQNRGAEFVNPKEEAWGGGGGGGISNKTLIRASDNNRKLLKDSGSCSQMERAGLQLVLCAKYFDT